MNRKSRRENEEGSGETAVRSWRLARITNIHFRHRIFILHVCVTATESILYITLIGTPTRYMFT